MSYLAVKMEICAAVIAHQKMSSRLQVTTVNFLSNEALQFSCAPLHVKNVNVIEKEIQIADGEIFLP